MAAQETRYIVDAAALAAQLDTVREMLLGGAKALPDAIAQLQVLSYALTHPNAPTLGAHPAGFVPDMVVEDLAELWRGTPAPSRPALRVVNGG